GLPSRSLRMRAVGCKGRIPEVSSSSCTSSRLRDSMLYDLRHADARIKWLVTCLLATLGLSYVFGALMVSLYAGFTPRGVAATYRGREMSMPMPPETTMVLEHPIAMAECATPATHNS